MADYRLKFMLFNHQGFTVFIIFEQHPFFTSTKFTEDHEFCFNDIRVGSVSYTDIIRDHFCLRGATDYTRNVTGAVCDVQRKFNVTSGIEVLTEWSRTATEFINLPVFEPYIVDVPEDVRKFIFPHIRVMKNVRLSKEDEEMLSQYASYV